MSSQGSPGNIDGRQRRYRLLNGILLALIGLFLVFSFLRDARPWWWLLLLFPLHLGSALGFLQARASTCILLANRGTCHLGGRPDQVTDPELREALRSRGRSIARRAFWVAAAVTAVTLALRNAL